MPACVFCGQDAGAWSNVHSACQEAYKRDQEARASASPSLSGAASADTPNSRPLPRTVQLGSRAAIIYGVLHSASTLGALWITAGLTPGQQGRVFGRQLVFSIIAVAIGVGLSRLRPWAWWIGMFLGILVAVTESFTLAAVMPSTPSLSQAVVLALFGAETIVLWVALVALYRPSSRAAFGMSHALPKSPAA